MKTLDEKAFGDSKLIETQEFKARVIKHTCGGIVFVTVPKQGKFSANAKREFKNFAEPGYTFEDISIEEARKIKWCECKS